MGPNGGVLPSSSSILWSKERWGGSEQALDSLNTSVNSWYSGGSLVKSEGSSSSGNAAQATVGDDSESDGDLKRMIVRGVSAFRVANSKAAAPTRATWIGFSEAGNEDEGGNEGEGSNEDEGVDTGGKNAFIQGLHGDYIVIF